MKKLLSMLLIFIIFLSLIVPVYAEKEESLYTNGNRVEKIYSIKDGIVEELSLEEYHKIVKVENFYEDYIEPAQNEIDPYAIREDWYRYDQSGSARNHLFTSERKRVSTVLHNGTNNSVKRVLSYTSSSSQGFSAGLTSAEINAVKIGASFTWNTSASVKDSSEITIQPSRYGWFEFAPYKVRTWGTVKKFNWLGEMIGSKSVVAYSPQKLNGNLDGILYAITSQSHP